MSAKKKEPKRQPWEVDWVECEMHREDKETLKTWDLDLEASENILANLVSSGYKFSLAGDPRHDCFIASLTSPKDTSGKRQQCLVARGPDPFAALRAVAYKHSVMLDGEWEGNANTFDPDSQWG